MCIRDSLVLSNAAFANLADIDGTAVYPGPAYLEFRRAVLERNPIAIVTARNHPPEELLRLLRKMTDDEGKAVWDDATLFWDQIYIYTCNSPSFEQRFKCQGCHITRKKSMAISEFLKVYPNATSRWYSDDDPENLEAVGKLFGELRTTRSELKTSLHLAVPGQGLSLIHI